MTDTNSSNNSSWPPPPETPGWPPNAEANAKNEKTPLSVLSTVARVSLNTLCFCITASFSLVTGVFLAYVGLPWLVATLLWLMLAGLSWPIKLPWLKAAFYSGAWGAGVAALCLIAYALMLQFGPWFHASLGK